MKNQDNKKKQIDLDFLSSKVFELKQIIEAL